MRRFAAPLLSIAGAGCITYPVTPVTELTPGRTVELTLADSQIAAMAPRLGPGVFRVTGKLAEIDSLALLVQVSHTTSTRNVHDHYAQNVHWNGDSVSIPRAGIATAREKRFNGWLTALGVAVAGGTMAVIANLPRHPGKLPPPTFP